jgi:hypothetical protein
VNISNTHHFRKIVISSFQPNHSQRWVTSVCRTRAHTHTHTEFWPSHVAPLICLMPLSFVAWSPPPLPPGRLPSQAVNWNVARRREGDEMQFKGHVPLHSQLCPTSVQSVVGNSSQYFVLFDRNVGMKNREFTSKRVTWYCTYRCTKLRPCRCRY